MDKNYKKIAAWWLGVFLVGGLGGWFFSQIVIPWLANVRPFNQIGWLCNVKDGTTIINKTEKVYITQNEAYREAISRAGASVVQVMAEKNIRPATGQADLIAIGNGFILTADGLIITSAKNAPKTATRVRILYEGKSLDAKIEKRDDKNNLVLLKVGEANLPIVAWGDTKLLQLGEMVFLIGQESADGLALHKFANTGFVRTLEPEISFDFRENQSAEGCPIANLKGEILGLSFVNASGDIKIILGDKIKEFLK